MSSPERFILSASPGCADDYPATILEAYFLTPYGSFPVPYGHLLYGDWGGSAIGWVGGDERQAAPDSLEIRWFSYTEDKFYEGHFQLPQAHIQALLKRGFWLSWSQKQETYNSLDLSVVPGGVVVVWLNGWWNQVLIGRYQAQEISYPFEKLAPGAERAASVREVQAELAPQVRHEIATGTLSSRKWDDYLLHYPWQVAFSQPLTISDYSIRYLSGEMTSDPPTADMAAYARQLTTPIPKAVPKSLVLKIVTTDGQRYKLKSGPFAEAEMQHAFQTLHARHPQEVLTLHVELDEHPTTVVLSLRAGTQVIPLPHCSMRVIDL